MPLSRKIYLVYLSGFLLAVHYASVAYVNSSLLKRYFSDEFVNIFYIVGSVASILILGVASWLLRRFGNAYSFVFFILLEVFAVFGLASFDLAGWVMFLFLVHHSAESMLYFCLDVHLEQEIRAEGVTGRTRGAYLTIQNIAWVLSPLALSFLVINGNFDKVYILSGLALLPIMFFNLFFFKNQKTSNLETTHIFNVFKNLIHDGDQKRILIVQFILNFFFSWMIIYLPFLLNLEIGFDWDKIGLILTVMLIPYLLFEFPAGFLADKKYGEREILFLGFIIMSLSTLSIAFIKVPTFWLWASILFVTRIGASMVEISSESYFFKHVKEEDTALISFFRMARPLSFIFAPLIAIPVLNLTNYGGSFAFLAIFSALGLWFIPKVDTK